MQVAVASGAWLPGSILSVRVGEVRRQAPLDAETSLGFQTVPAAAEDLVVDVFSRVWSSRLTYDASKEVYDLNIDREGFSEVALRVTRGEGTSSSSSTRRRLENAMVEGEYVDEHGLHDLAAIDGGAIGGRPGRASGDVARPFPSAPAGPPPSSARPGGQQWLATPSGSSTPSTRGDPLGVVVPLTAEARHAKQRAAIDYIERHELRQVLQDIFQRTIRERPDRPLEFIQKLLCSSNLSPPSGPLQSAEASDAEERLATALAAVTAAEAAAQSAKEEVETQRRAFAEASAQLAERLAAAEAAAWVAADTAKQQAESQRAAPVEGDPAAAEAAGIAEQLVAAEAAASTAAAAAEIAKRDSETQRAALIASEGEVARLNERVKELEMLGASLQEELRAERSATAERLESSRAEAVAAASHDAAIVAATARATEEERTALQKQVEEQANQARAAQMEMEKMRIRLELLEQVAPSTPGIQVKRSDVIKDTLSPAVSTTPGTTQMSADLRSTLAGAFSGTPPHDAALSQMMASSYAPALPSSRFYEPREDLDQDTDGSLVSGDLLLEITCCKDKTANGTYGRVGDCNSRPLYRLLGPEPRYLYYAAIDTTWQGWWIADKMGSHDYVEWFSQPSEARLPTCCRPGELGGRVSETCLSREVVQRLATIGSAEERAIIRERLTKAYGPQFAKLDGSQRGLMAKTSPVVAVAYALEAQQRAIQLLHSQLAVAQQHRQAAEAHAQTMEEAFETLQLRIQANLPGGGVLMLKAPHLA